MFHVFIYIAAIFTARYTYHTKIPSNLSANYYQYGRYFQIFIKEIQSAQFQIKNANSDSPLILIVYEFLNDHFNIPWNELLESRCTWSLDYSTFIRFDSRVMRPRIKISWKESKIFFETNLCDDFKDEMTDHYCLWKKLQKFFLNPIHESVLLNFKN